MAKVQILVLGNDAFADKLGTELKREDIPHNIDQDINTGRVYDWCICPPHADIINKVKTIACGTRIMVFNGVQMSNQILKSLVRLRIAGFIENHDDPAEAVAVIRQTARAKEKVSRISQKILALTA